MGSMEIGPILLAADGIAIGSSIVSVSLWEAVLWIVSDSSGRRKALRCSH